MSQASDSNIKHVMLEHVGTSCWILFSTAYPTWQTKKAWRIVLTVYDQKKGPHVLEVLKEVDWFDFYFFPPWFLLTDI